MKKRELGKSGIFVSEISLGCMSLPNDKEKAKAIIDTALEAGINFFDTADLYDSGKNEMIVGSLLKEKRDDIILSTKVGNERIAGEDGWRWNPKKAYIMEAVKESLRRLKTDYIDLYQLHGGTMEDDASETIDAFETLKKEGIIRQYGISSIRPNVINRFLKKSNAVSVMMQYSLLDRRPEEWFSMIHDEGASIITRGTLAKGLLTNDGLVKADQLNGFAEYSTSEMKETVKMLLEETANLHATAIAFNLQNEAIASTVIGASTKEQLLDTILAYEADVSQSDLKALENKLHLHKYQEHRV
ncbi:MULTISPECIES: aldo/keto reductase [Sporosarcina]|uniref:Aldo/keto reductase n=1 Tax=Sporosarcina contaminans TaxID=633403 RepID=A0ABW3U4A2_9BACL